jgi:hypothetical protein
MKPPSKICHCGHEKAEHFDKAHNCMRQCDCLEFLSESEPKPLPPRPNHALACRCFTCKQYPMPEQPSPEFDWDEDTDPILPWP